MKKGRFSFRAACFSCRRIFFIQKKMPVASLQVL